MALTPFADLPLDLQASLTQKRPGAQQRGNTPRVLWLSMRSALQRGPTPEEWHKQRKRTESQLSERLRAKAAKAAED